MSVSSRSYSITSAVVAPRSPLPLPQHPLGTYRGAGCAPRALRRSLAPTARPPWQNHLATPCHHRTPTMGEGAGVAARDRARLSYRRRARSNER